MKYVSSDPNKGKEKNSNFEMILTTDTQLRTIGLNEHTKNIYVFFSRKVSYDESRL